MRRRTAWTLTGAATALLVTGCGERPGLDSAGVERYLVHSQAGVFGPGATIGRARCPEDADLREGMTLACTLRVSGTTVPYRVTLTHVHGDRVHVAARADGVVVPASAVRAQVRKGLSKAAAAADVDCGGDLLVARVGGTVPCSLVSGAQTEPITVTVVDAAGTVRVG